MKITSVSLDQIWLEKAMNLESCEKHIKSSAEGGSELIVFPEMTLTGFSLEVEKTGENLDSSYTIQSFCSLAKRYNIAIIFGVVTMRGIKGLNQCIFVDPMGKIQGNYTKVHPFSYSGETESFHKGSNLSVVNYNGVKFGLTICYDLRFPEIYSALACDADMIVNIANWPSKRVDHWNALLKARAIENQCYIFGVNRTGIDGNGLSYVESSRMLFADGHDVKGSDREGCIDYYVDLSAVKDYKKSFNTTNDRRIELYKEFL